MRYRGLDSQLGGEWRGKRSWSEVEGRSPRFTGPVACLIDENTFSVADYFAACLRDVHHDVVFVGRPTGGGSGAPRPFELPATGARVTFCTMHVWAPNGACIEGQWVTPYIAVLPSRSERLEERDVVLGVAVELLRKGLQAS